MTYIENIFLCMVSPLLVAALCMGRRQLRLFLFSIAGMGVCLLSAYINTFLAAVCQADALAATAEIAPCVRLHPENPKYPDIYTQNCTVQGVAVHVIKSLE